MRMTFALRCMGFFGLTHLDWEVADSFLGRWTVRIASQGVRAAVCSPRRSMIQGWIWLVVGALVVLVGYQRFRFNEIQRQSKKREELFQIVAENAADMIALVDMKGRRLYNSPAYKKILGYSPAELGETSSFEQIHPED